LIAAGPLLAILSAAAVGGAVGGFVGALTGLGIPESEATRSEGKIREGNILISVHCEKGKTMKKARNIFSWVGALDISSSSERPVRKEDRKGQPA
jgi:hypothetical protein